MIIDHLERTPITNCPARGPKVRETDLSLEKISKLVYVMASAVAPTTAKERKNFANICLNLSRYF